MLLKVFLPIYVCLTFCSSLFFPPCRSLRTLIQRYLPSMMSQMSKFLSSLVFRSTLSRKSILLCCTWFFIDSSVFTLLPRFLCFFIAQKTNKIPVFFREFILINDPCSSSVYARKQKRDGFMCEIVSFLICLRGLHAAKQSSKANEDEKVF